MTLELARERLFEILATMDLPPARVAVLDRSWLLRNIGIRNQGHRDLDEAIQLLKLL